jgi:hypothetical protein
MYMFCDIVINTKGVFKLLKDLNPLKATGPDCIPSFILKSTADELAPILTQLYQYSLAEEACDEGLYQKPWQSQVI